MLTRAMILERAGHTVITAKGKIELETVCHDTRFDVAVIGQVISSDMKRTFSKLIRNNCPTAKILELYSPHEGRQLPDADAWLEVPADVPDDLASRVEELAQI